MLLLLCGYLVTTNSNPAGPCHRMISQQWCFYFLGAGGWAEVTGHGIPCAWSCNGTSGCFSALHWRFPNQPCQHIPVAQSPRAAHQIAPQTPRARAAQATARRMSPERPRLPRYGGPFKGNRRWPCAGFWVGVRAARRDPGTVNDLTVGHTFPPCGATCFYLLLSKCLAVETDTQTWQVPLQLLSVASKECLHSILFSIEKGNLF